jgi:RNA polymerase sigma factor (TIGR02999 family)
MKDPPFEKLVTSAQAGSAAAMEALFAALYHELHRLAEHNLRNAHAPATLGATTLLHEAYMNIARREQLAFPNEGSFLSYASRAMRGLVIDYARRRRALKRGSHFEVTLLEDQAAAAPADADELERLSDALDELAQIDQKLAELVDLHFFCGYAFTEIARLRQVSERTVQRDWRKARMLLHAGLLDAASVDTAP